MSARVVVVLGLAGLAACGRVGFDGAAASDAPPDQAPADGGDPCPPTAVVAQHDEDGDGRGDACDGCPHVADDGTDGDGDGVGDACDPAPATGGNRLRAFLAFADATLPDGWVAEAQNTTWSAADDLLGVALTNGDVAIVTADLALGARVRVDARVTIDVINPEGGSPGRNVSVVEHLAGAPGSEDTLMFGLHHDASNALPAEVTVFRLSGGGNAGQFAIAPLTGRLTPRTVDLRYDRVGTARTVRVSPPGVEVSTDLPEVGGRIGFRVRGLTVRLHHLVVIE